MSRDITYCSHALCPNTECDRNISHINWADDKGFNQFYSHADFPDCAHWNENRGSNEDT